MKTKCKILQILFFLNINGANNDTISYIEFFILRFFIIVCTFNFNHVEGASALYVRLSELT